MHPILIRLALILVEVRLHALLPLYRVGALGGGLAGGGSE